MSRADDLDDALVDTYRALRAMNEAARSEPAPQPTRGAGVDPRKVVRPGKRLRNWHRQSGRAGESLRSFVRGIAASEPETQAGRNARAVADSWLASKGARP